MKHLLPRRVELALFGLVALCCGFIAAMMQAHNIGLFVCAMPIFVLAAWMGMRRSGQWAAIAPEITAAEVEEEEVA